MCGNIPIYIEDYGTYVILYENELHLLNGDFMKNCHNHKRQSDKNKIQFYNNISIENSYPIDTYKSNITTILLSRPWVKLNTANKKMNKYEQMLSTKKIKTTLSSPISYVESHSQVEPSISIIKTEKPNSRNQILQDIIKDVPSIQNINLQKKVVSIEQIPLRYRSRKFSQLYDDNYKKELFKSIKLSNILPVTFIYSILRLLKPRNILDINIEDGILFESSILYDVNNYVGVIYPDKNPDVQNIIQSIYKKYEPTIDIFIGSINNILQHSMKKYDMVFAYEKSFDLMSYINMSWDMLNIGGFLLCITENKYSDIIDNMDSKDNCYLQSILNYNDDNSNFALLIYRKLESPYDPYGDIRNTPSYHEILSVKFELPLRTHIYNENKFNVYRGDKLIGGIKQIALYSIMQQYKENNIFYYDDTYDSAVLSIAIVCMYLAKQFHLITPLKYDNNDRFNIISKLFGAKIHYIPKLNNIQDSLLKEQSKIDIINNIMSNYENKILLPIGLDMPDMTQNYLYGPLNEIKKYNKIVKNVWIVLTIDSIRLFNALYRFLPPLTKYHIILIDDLDKSKLGFYNPDNITFYNAPESLLIPAKNLPPYPSDIYRDAKLWQFIMIHGQDGDFIFNCAE